MNVRKGTKTTLSLLVILLIMEYLLSKYLYMLERYIPSFWERLVPFDYMGDYYPVLIYIVAGIIVLVCIIDAILKNKVAFEMISAFNIPIILAIGVLILLRVAQISLFRLWGLFFLLMLVGLYWTFKKHLDHVGFKGKGNAIYNNPIDDFTVYSLKLLIMLAGGVVLISLIVYLISHWKLIF